MKTPEESMTDFSGGVLHFLVLGLPGTVRVLLEVAEKHSFFFDHELRDFGEHEEDLFFCGRLVRAHGDDMAKCPHVAGPDAASRDAHADDASQAGGHSLFVVEVVTAFFHVPDTEELAVELLGLAEGLVEHEAAGRLARSEVVVISGVFPKRGRHPERDVLVEADVPHASFGNRPSSAVTIHLAGENATDAFDSEVVDRMFKDRPVTRGQDVVDVRDEVGADLRDVWVEARLEALVAALGRESNDEGWVSDRFLVGNLVAGGLQMVEPPAYFFAVDGRLSDTENLYGHMHWHGFLLVLGCESATWCSDYPWMSGMSMRSIVALFVI